MYTSDSLGSLLFSYTYGVKLNTRNAYSYFFDLQ